MKQGEKIIYGDTEITHGSEFEKIEDIISAIGYLRSKENLNSQTKTPQIIEGLTAGLRKELEKLDAKKVEHYLLFRLDYWYRLSDQLESYLKNKRIYLEIETDTTNSSQNPYKEQISATSMARRLFKEIENKNTKGL